MSTHGFRSVPESVVASDARVAALEEALAAELGRPLRSVLMRYLHDHGVPPARDADALVEQVREQLRCEDKGG